MSDFTALFHTVVFEKQGSFVHTYGNDAKVISSLFRYRTKYVKNRHSLMCGFPISCLVKNLRVVIDEEISYRCDFDMNIDTLGEKQYGEFVKASELKGLSGSVLFNDDKSYLYYLDRYQDSSEINSHNDGCVSKSENNNSYHNTHSSIAYIPHGGGNTLKLRKV